MSNKIITNIIPKDSLRAKQRETLEILADTLSKTFGPFGSNTIKYMNDGYPRYTKDGHTVLSSIMFNGEIERSVLADIEEETRAQAKRVGDSTTSVTILSNLIFKGLCEIEDKYTNIPPADIVRYFKEVIELVCEHIKENGRETTLDDIYNISLISTNGDDKLATEIRDVYEKYGLGVFIDVLAGSGEKFITRPYDGMVLDCGFDDASFVNIIGKNLCRVEKARIYFFYDPIDTFEMGKLFDKIIETNIIEPASNKKECVPTVIVCPKISRDYSATLNYLSSICGKMVAQGIPNNLPIDIVTGISTNDFVYLDDIVKLCGAKYIHKYIDEKVLKSHQEKELAPTLDNITDFCGYAEAVESGPVSTKFVNPKCMRNKDGSFSDIFNGIMINIDASLKNLEEQHNETLSIYQLKKRKNSLKGNMVELYVGGLTVADRDQAKDLVEDAVLNCRSAVEHGVGYGANFEGLRALRWYKDCTVTDSDVVSEEVNVKADIATHLYDAFYQITELLYKYFKPAEGVEIEENAVEQSLKNGAPFNLRTGEIGTNVLSTIDTDICALNSISKIISLMVTANQFLLPTFNTSKY